MPTKLKAKPTTRPARASKPAPVASMRGKPTAAPVKPPAPAELPRRATARSTKPAEPPTPTPAGTKQSQLIAMLRSSQGASITQMTGATGWQRHTVRGTISGVLRKKLGLNVACSAPDAAGNRVYRIVEAAAA